LSAAKFKKVERCRGVGEEPTWHSLGGQGSDERGHGRDSVYCCIPNAHMQSF